MKQGFIYLIRNLVTNHVYVGQTDRTLKIRWQAHWSNAKTASSTYLRRALNKYGKGNFTIEVIETTSINQLDDAEIKWIAHYESFTDRTKGYNLTAGGGGLRGMKHSEESKRKMSEANRGEKNYLFGKHHSEETKKLMSEALVGKPKSAETKSNMSRAQKGRIIPPDAAVWGNTYAAGNTNRLGISHTDESKAKMSKKLKGRKYSPEESASRAAGRVGWENPLKGKSPSDETRLKMSIAKTGTKRSPEVCEAISKFHTGRKRSPETVERLRASAFARPSRGPASEETKTKMKAAQSARRAAETLAGVKLNVLSGEDHPHFGKSPSLETREKMRAAKATPESKEQRAQLSRQWWVDNPNTDETRKRMSDSGKNRAPISDATRENMRAASVKQWAIRKARKVAEQAA